MKAARDSRLDSEQLALKVASRKATKAAGGPSAVAQATGFRQQRLSDCGLPNVPEFLRVDEVAAIEELAVGAPGWPHVTQALCRRAGGVFVRLPLSEIGSADWHQAMGAAAKESNDVTVRLCTALCDGTVTAAEIQQLSIREEIAEAQQRLAALDAMCVALTGDTS